MSSTLGLPGLTYFFTEAARASLELYDFYRKRDELLERTPPGDARPVLVLPGFGASDNSTMIMRQFLNDKGFYAHGWNNGLNLGPSDDSLRQMSGHLHEVFNRHGGRKVALIGHSLGGVYARELGRVFPDKVEQVITLASPFSAGQNSELSIRIMLGLFHIAYGRQNPAINNLAAPLPVPTTAVYSQTDGVVNWRQCINPPGAGRENIEITGSHVGMGMNLQSLLVVIDRLNQRPGEWVPFERQKYLDVRFPVRQGHENYDFPQL